jgi:hypothetical protein
MTGVKRKFIEILDSDDETDTIYTDSDSEFHPDPTDELKDDIEDLNDDNKVLEKENDALLSLLVKERETNNLLREEIKTTKHEAETLRDHRDRLISNIKELQNTALVDLLLFLVLLTIISGICVVATLYTC